TPRVVPKAADEAAHLGPSCAKHFKWRSMMVWRMDGAASGAERKAFSAEVGVAWVRFAVIAFNVPVYWLFLAPQGVPWLAVVISVVAGLYAVVIVTLRPYRRFPAMTTAAWTATTDASLIVLWIQATGGFASPYYLLWYLSLFAVTFRYDARATWWISVLYAVLYAGQL